MVSSAVFHESTQAAMVQHYLDATALTRIAVLGMNGGTSTRFTTSPELARDAGGVNLAALYWTQFETEANLIVS